MTIEIDGKPYWGPSLFPELDLIEFPGGMHNWQQRVTCDDPLVRATSNVSTVLLAVSVPARDNQ